MDIPLGHLPVQQHLTWLDGWRRSRDPAWTGLLLRSPFRLRPQLQTDGALPRPTILLLLPGKVLARTNHPEVKPNYLALII